MKISLFPWESVWVINGFFLILSVIWIIIRSLRAKKLLLPQTFPVYLSLLAFILIPAGLWAFNYRFDIGPGNKEETVIEHPLVDLEMHRYDEDEYTIQELYEASLHAVQSLETYKQPWTITYARIDESLPAARIHVQVPVMFFIDNLIISITPAQREATTWVYVASSSQVGVSDFGANARHIKQFHLALEEELSKIR